MNHTVSDDFLPPRNESEKIIKKYTKFNMYIFFCLLEATDFPFITIVFVAKVIPFPQKDILPTSKKFS